MALSLPGSLWRVGSSMALYIFRTSRIAPYSPPARDRIILSILTSSKYGPLSSEMLEHWLARADEAKTCPWACIIGSPGEEHPSQSESGLHSLPGPSWAHDGKHDIRTYGPSKSVLDGLLDWTGDSFDALAAVAHAAVSSATTADPIITCSHISELVQEASVTSPAPNKFPDSPVLIPVRILLAHAERVAVVHVPVNRLSMSVHYPLETSYDEYTSLRRDSLSDAPVASIETEIPTGQVSQLPTGHTSDTINLSGSAVEVSVIQTLQGAVILVDPTTIILPLNEEDGLTMLLPDALNTHYPQLPSLLLLIQDQVVACFPTLQALSTVPTICLVGDMEHDGYTTVDGRYLCCCQADLSVRALTESGQWDHSLSESVVVALAIAQGLKGTVAYNMWLRSQMRSCGGGREERVDEYLHRGIVKLWAAHPSGVIQADAKFLNTEIGHSREAHTVVLRKTPSELMRGAYEFDDFMALIVKF
ncbi:hypothetical protein B0H10DRAFT_2365445 [Mycena sp. CBHHK59/15]|nr:hypothetical protein B0H10DRAFT_2365445 [Mycena sp. CBHHK59/15]